jgi:hypothetical protein
MDVIPNLDGSLQGALTAAFSFEFLKTLDDSIRMKAVRMTTETGESLMTRRMTVGIVLALLALALRASAQVAPATLAELVADAGTIVAGRVVDVREGRHPEYRNVVVTFITLEVAEVFKDTRAKVSSAPPRLTFMQFGNPRTLPIHDIPSYRPGEEVVLFLYPDSRYGLTSPVAGGQGKFIVEHDLRTGVRHVVNGVNNWNLLRGLDAERLGLSATERTVIGQARGAISYDVFASLVKRLVRVTEKKGDRR